MPKETKTDAPLWNALQNIESRLNAIEDSAILEQEQSNQNKKNTFEIFNKINVNDYTEKKGNFTYLSWAWAVRELLKVSHDATWHVFEYKSDNGDSQPYMKTDSGYFVKVSVSVEGVTRTQTHPVLDN